MAFSPAIIMTETYFTCVDFYVFLVLLLIIYGFKKYTVIYCARQESLIFLLILDIVIAIVTFLL